jgi:hypothetical protein
MAQRRTSCSHVNGSVGESWGRFPGVIVAKSVEGKRRGTAGELRTAWKGGKRTVMDQREGGGRPGRGQPNRYVEPHWG